MVTIFLIIIVVTLILILVACLFVAILLSPIPDLLVRFSTPTGRFQARIARKLKKKYEEDHHLREFIRKLDMTEDWYIDLISQLDSPKNNRSDL